MVARKNQSVCSWAWSHLDAHYVRLEAQSLQGYEYSQQADLSPYLFSEQLSFPRPHLLLVHDTLSWWPDQDWDVGL